MGFFPRGIVTLVFDDGYQEIYDSVVPLLNEYKIPAVFAVPLEGNRVEASENRAVAPWELWMSLSDQGHEIASHGITHTSLPKLSPEALDRELKEPAQALHAATLVYPGGGVNDIVVERAKKYYQAARTVKRGFEALPPEDPWHLKTFDYTRRNFSILKANMRAVQAVIKGAWLIETYHMVSNHDVDMTHSVPLDAFINHLAFLKRLPIQFKTIAQVMREYA